MKFSIKAKLSAAFTLILLLLISISLLMANKLSDANTRLTGLVDVSSKKVMLSNEILISILEAARQEKNIILETDPIKKDDYKALINNAVSNVNNKVPELEKLVDDEGKKYLDEFKIIWDKHLVSIQEIVSLSYKNETEKAFEISSTVGFAARNQSVILLNRLIEKNKADMVNDKKVSDANYDAAIRLIMVLIGLSIIAAVITAYWIIKSITSRISDITKEAEKIASREYSEVRTDTTFNDELQPVFQSLSSINDSFKEVTQHAFKVASGNYSDNFKPKSDKDILGNALKKMTKSLKETTEENEKHNWLSTGLNQLSEKLRGDKEVEELGSDTLSFLCDYTKAQIGALYLSETNDVLEFVAGHAFSGNQKRAFAFKEGLVGEAAYAQKPIYLDVSKEDTLVMNSSLMERKPNHIIIVPFIFEGKTMGVLEMGSLHPFTETEKEFINSTLDSIAISINSALSRRKIQMLLEETQVQSEELQSQQEELRQMNEELEEQTQSLKQQQEELQITNEELEEQTQALEMKNSEVELARKDIELKNTQIEASSKYKSEFLANMSHELRTPLNSLLILSKDLSENRNDNLTVDQVESAEIIYNSGHDLLNLINEVLDLSKIEAGKMSVNVERIDLKELADSLYRNFKHQAELKKLAFRVEMKDNLPEYIMTDRQRLDQILKNILSNAVKFTDKGEITITVSKNENSTVSIAIKDTGIGIAKEKQQSVFEAFQQADGGTSRKYGGTGLGLSISRELIKLIGAELQLESEPNKGSVFTLTIPLEYKEEEGALATVPAPYQMRPKFSSNGDLDNTESIPDDRNGLEADDKVVLIIEDDLKFATVLLKQAHQKGFKGVVGATGEAGLLLAERFRPHAIIMDMNLPGINGESLLNEIKENPVLRHIPVHIISGEDRSLEMIKKGAIEYFRKPVGKGQLEEAFNRIENFISRKMKNLLIVETDAESRLNMCNLIGNGDVKCLQAQTGKEALEIYSENHIDCIVLDIDLEDMNGFTLIKELEKLKPGGMPPIIVYTGRMLTKEENDELEKSTETIIIKGTKSEERLLDETALFLHRAISGLPESKQKMISNLHDRDALFKNKKIILTDDDMRNVFALSKVLKERGIEVLKAENGKRAIEMLENNPDANLILMDIMMPEMDGYEAIRQIRLQSKFKNLPIIALTAKAMKEDRQKCIDAGANDYITKPVDVERLLSLMRVWLSK